MRRSNSRKWRACLPRKSSCFAKGASKYRGVSRQPGHERHGKWQARISCPSEAYDIAAIIIRRVNAVTNFDRTCYDVARIQEAAVLDGHYGPELVERKEESK